MQQLWQHLHLSRLLLHGLSLAGIGHKVFDEIHNELVSGWFAVESTQWHVFSVIQENLLLDLPQPQ